MAHFSIENLTFSYPRSIRPALDGLSLSIQRGSYVVLCGKSGCGKTTLLRHLKPSLTPCGLRSGRVTFDSLAFEEVSHRDQCAKIGYVMQDPDAQVVTEKVWHELAFGLESMGVEPSVMRLRVAEMASYFGIQGWFRKDVRDLSGGQKQLLSLASVMAMQPEALLLDEPTAQLDPIAAADFLGTIRKINLELGTTVVITEHRLEEVFPCADKVVVLDRGRLIAEGPPRTVGMKLHADDDDMAVALPTPMRVFCGVSRADASSCANADDAVSSDEAMGEAVFDADAAGERGSSSGCPLTVREGRAWLSRRCDPSLFASVPPSGESCEKQAALDVAIELDEVWLRYGKDLPDVLRGVSMRIPHGVISAVVGGNGAGKSTMLKAIAGVVRPYRGSIRVDGRVVGGRKKPIRSPLVLLPQEPRALFVGRTVREDLLEMLDDPGLSSSERDERLGRVAEMVEVSHVLDAHPYDLSGGECQRAALAKALLAEPRILLLDEPTKGIDCFFKRSLASILSRLRDGGATIVMVSHDIEFCARHVDEVSMFFDGSIAATNSARRFFSGNSFYTTAANRMSRHVLEDAITDEDVISLCARS